MVAGAEVADQGGGDGGHAARGAARGFRAFQPAHALLEHRHRRVGVARIDEARIVALEAGLGRLGIGVDEALGQEHGFRGLAELRPHRAAVHQFCGGAITFLSVSHGGISGSNNKNPGRAAA